MLRRIALHGPIGSGKTSLAKALRDGHQYMWVNYTDFLKTLVSNAICTYGGVQVSIEEMNANKEQWRPLINAYGDAIDFANRADFIDEALAPWYEARFKHSPTQPVVFDNIRSVFQAEVLRSHGFTVVKLQADKETLHQRRPATDESRNHWIEQPLPDDLIDYYVDATRSPEDVVRQVMGL